MCVNLLVRRIAKMRGDTWWDGSALWFAFASLEYQSLDMTWTVKPHRWFFALFPHHHLLGNVLLLPRVAEI